MTQYGVPSEAHIPVFRDRVCELLAPALSHDSAICIDATLGAGGHTEALLSEHPQLTVLGIDRDTDALALASQRLERFGDRFVPVHAVYDQVAEVLAERDIPAIDGILFDLGVSSMQLDVAERGFAYSQDAPLDMRMDQTRGRTAAEIVNEYDERDLSRILKVYGEERFASRIAKAVVKQRKAGPITSSGQLVDLVRDAVPAAARRRGGNPAKRTFQALRIEVNAELEVLRRAIPAALDALAAGGRIVVLSYHSLEDRIVKRELATRTTSSAPPGLPIDIPGTGPTMRLISKGAQPPSDEEITANPRAASAKLRAAEALPTDMDHLDAPRTVQDRRSHGEDAS